MSSGCGSPVAGGGFMRQRHSQGYASSGDDLDDDAASRFSLASPPPPRTRTWTEIVEYILWIASAAFIVYFGDRHSNLIYLLWHDGRIRRIPLYLGMVAVGLNIIIFLYTSIIAWGSRRFDEKWEFIGISTLPYVTLLGIIAFCLLSFAVWPIWSFLALPLLRELHSRNKKAMEFIARGWSALKEVDRVIDYAELNDRRLIPLLRTAKENFELALEADNSNTHARYWLAKLHLKYHVPGKCLAVGAALLVEAANMGDPEAQYELACRLRVEHENFPTDQQAFYYLEKAVDQLHPGALYLLGAVYLTGDCVKQDLASAMWCFHRASEKGHAGAAIAYGALLLRGVQVPEYLTRFDRRGGSAAVRMRKEDKSMTNLGDMARKHFEVAAKSGCELGFKWLGRLEEEEQRLLLESE